MSQTRSTRYRPFPSSTLNNINGTAGEVYFDTTTGTLRIFTGVEKGGYALARADFSNISTAVFNAKALEAGIGGSSFSYVAVAGQNSVIAENPTDTLNLAAGSGISITTNAATDTVTITNTRTLGNFTFTDNTVSLTTQSAIVFDRPVYFGSTVTGLDISSLGLGNVTNESKATMFNNPTFTGTVVGVTAAMVGLGNVTNESKATMFASPTFTGNTTINGLRVDGLIGLGGANYGSVGQVLTSQGSNAPPVWAPQTGGGGGGGSGTVTSVSVASANGFAGTVANASTTASITISTSLSGILKGNGTALSSAVGGVDYLAPPSGTAILKANNSSGLANAVAGTDYLAPPSGTAILKANSGSALANAVAGTDYLVPPSGTALLKANSGSALANAVAGTDYLVPPSGTAILKANSGGALSNAVAGTDYQAPLTLTTTGFTGAATLVGSTLNIPQYGNSGAVLTPNPNSVSGTFSMNCALYDTFNITVTGATTLSPTNVPSSHFKMYVFVTYNGGSISAYPTGTKWPSGAAPTQTGTTNKTDIFYFSTIDAGTNWFATVIGQNY